jgi:CubicO group peptidase (beta-lactamase class C family)
MKLHGLGALLLLVSALVVIAAAPPAAKPEDVGLSSARLQRIAQMLQRHVAAGTLAGGVAVVGRRDKVAYTTAQGVMDLETRRPMAPATMFRIASMTKPIIGAAVMMLVEDGKIRLQDPVSRYIPAFRAMKVGAVPAAREITITDLLTHTSGLGSGPASNAAIERVARKEGERLADYIPRLGGTTLEFQPGSRWAYSSFAGFETLGYVIEVASGMPLDRFLRTRLFDPLGMSDITFWPSAEQTSRRATIYLAEGGRLQKTVMPNDLMSRNVYFRGSGGLYSTAESYVPFGLMLANGGELNGTRVLSRKSVEMMTAVHVPDTLPGRPAGEGFGLSVRVVTNHAVRGTMLSSGTYGWSGAQGTHFFVDPREGLVGVLMIQTPDNEIRGDFENLVAQAVDD